MATKTGKFATKSAEAFISDTAKAEEHATDPVSTYEVPKGYKLVPEGSRVAPPAKTARIQLLVVPETHRLLKDLAKKEGTSVNALASEAFDMLFKAHGIK